MNEYHCKREKRSREQKTNGEGWAKSKKWEKRFASSSGKERIRRCRDAKEKERTKIRWRHNALVSWLSLDYNFIALHSMHWPQSTKSFCWSSKVGHNVTICLYHYPFKILIHIIFVAQLPMAVIACKQSSLTVKEYIFECHYSGNGLTIENKLFFHADMPFL